MNTKNHNWIKRVNSNTVGSYLQEKGLNLNDLLDPQPVPPSSIEGMSIAAEIIQKYAIGEKWPVVVIGDYDADGITSTAILVKLLRHLGIEANFIIPRRFSDGYGMSAAMVENISNSLIITVDNGIAAIDAVKKAKENGNMVVILDHHLPGEELPCADVIVDPHVSPEKNGFIDYCGAGLAYKLAEYFYSNTPSFNLTPLFYNDITLLATIGTISDVMPLIGDNRRIVKFGLEIVRSKRTLSAGLQWLIQWVGAPFDEDSIKFKIGPILNAPGRLYDAGGTSSLKMLLCQNALEAGAYLEKMIQINDRRKDLTQTCVDKAISLIDEANRVSNILILRIPGMPEGLTGLVAGKLAEQYRCVTFVFAEAKNERGVWKGSGRSFGGFDMSGIIPAVQDIVVAAGGHAGAAGISVHDNMFDTMKSAMLRFMEQFGEQDIDDNVYYDINIETVDDAINAISDLKKYAPFGEGVPKPVFAWHNFTCVEAGKGSLMHFRTMGTNQQHLKLFGPGIEAIGFNMASDYGEMGTPETISLLGNLQENHFNGMITPQFAITEFKA